MRRTALAYVFILIAALLLAAEILTVLARFGMFAGTSEVVPVRSWGWADVWRLLGTVGFGAAGYWLLRPAQRSRDGA